MKRLLIVLMLLVFGLVGCASWQKNVTGSYVAGKTGLVVIKDTLKPACDTGTIKPAPCISLKDNYNKTRTAYVAAGTTLILALTTTDAIQQKNLQEQYATIYANFQVLTQQLVQLIQEIQADTTKTPAPPKLKKFDPATISVIISGIMAVFKEWPTILKFFQNVSPQTVADFVKQIQDAQNSLPVWN